MRLTVFIAALALVSFADGVAQMRVAPPRSGLLMGGGPTDCFFGGYTDPPWHADCVYFQGEPITYRISVGNLGPANATLAVESPEPKRLFQVRVMHAPGAASSITFSSPTMKNAQTSDPIELRLRRETVHRERKEALLKDGRDELLIRYKSGFIE